MCQILNIPFLFQSNKHNAKFNNRMLIITLFGGFNSYAPHTLTHYSLPWKGIRKKASKPNREGPKNPFTGKKKKTRKSV